MASAGPLRIAFKAPPGPLHDLIAATLSLYDVEWSQSPMREVELVCTVGGPPLADARGDYLEAVRMLVDALPDGVRATTRHGGSIEATFTDSGERWSMNLADDVMANELSLLDLEDMLSLVLTIGWRRAGWVPLHAGGLTDGRRGLLVCAGGGGGKTTFTLAMARRGWRALGDDKLLVAMNGRPGYVAAIKHMLNVDPAVRQWFPEVGDLSALPQYSSFSPKRRVPLGRFWPSAPAFDMSTTHLLTIDRQRGVRGITVSAMSTADAISTLLHQSVIPREPGIAGAITQTLATMAQRVTGLRVTVGDGAYADADALSVVEHALG